VWPRLGDTVDHGAQFFLAETAEFQAAVGAWADAGLVREWPASGIGRLTNPGAADAPWTFAPFNDDKTRWVGGGTGGLGGLATSMAQALPPRALRTDVWVSPSNGLRKNSDGTWSLKVNGKEIGRHNKGIKRLGDFERLCIIGRWRMYLILRFVCLFLLHYFVNALFLLFLFFFRC
jgi:predicted NAD/FAD-dependent oxidoreductase